MKLRRVVHTVTPILVAVSVLGGWGLKHGQRIGSSGEAAVTAELPRGLLYSETHMQNTVTGWEKQLRVALAKGID